MAQPFLGEIRLFAGNYAPQGWALCHGQLLPIAENLLLYRLIGTTFGGDGITTFALPNLQSRMPKGMGNGYTLAQTGGLESVTLTRDTIPNHTHHPAGTAKNGNQAPHAGIVWAATSAGGVGIYRTILASTALNPGANGVIGKVQPHENRSPYLALNFIIALFGDTPTPNTRTARSTTTTHTTRTRTRTRKGK